MAWESAPPAPWSPPPLGPETWAPGADPRRLRFSRTEARHLSLALGALVAAFVILYTVPPLYGAAPPHPNPLGLVLLVTAIIGPAFVLHEMAHKVVAQRKGCWAEFRAFPRGLLLMLATALIGFLFAAPGAVMIAGTEIRRRDYGLIGAAGPLTNVLMAGVALPVLLTSFREVASLAVYINLFLAGFNMLPFAPFDGEKVLKGGGKGMFAGVVGAIAGVGGVAWLLLRP
ncbi:MAG: metalloprotease [Halobacteria archaeon]